MLRFVTRRSWYVRFFTWFFLELQIVRKRRVEKFATDSILSIVSPGFLAFKSWSGAYTAAVTAQSIRDPAHALNCSPEPILFRTGRSNRGEGRPRGRTLRLRCLGQTIVDNGWSLLQLRRFSAPSTEEGLRHKWCQDLLVASSRPRKFLFVIDSF